jgi:hypothetical protein
VGHRAMVGLALWPTALTGGWAGAGLAGRVGLAGWEGNGVLGRSSGPFEMMIWI